MTPSPESAIRRTRRSRILVRSTNWVGDAVMNMPAVQRLREWNPEAHIGLVCPAKLHDLWRRNPFLNEVIPFVDSVDTGALRQREFDLAVILPNSFRSAWECWQAGIPRRVGFAGHVRRWLLTDVVAEPRVEKFSHKTVTVSGLTFQIKSVAAQRHQIHRYLDLVSYLGGSPDFVPPKIYLAVEDMPPTSTFFSHDGRLIVGLNAGAEYGPAKRWLADRFAKVAQLVSQEIDCRWVLFGGPGDVETARVIEDQLRAAGFDPGSILNLAGKTSLLELCTLIRCCAVLLTNDTGPMHLAGALGTPVVAVFGSTSPELTGPLGDRDIVVRQPVECSPCFLRECPIDFRCMERVTVEQVAEAVQKQLHRTIHSPLRTGKATPASSPPDDPGDHAD